MRGTLPGAGKTYVSVAVLVSLFAAAAFSSSVSLVQAAPADEGKAVYDQKCKSCHTIGGGRLVGPDLKGLLERRDRTAAIRQITSPTGMMPNMGVSQQDAEKVLAYLEAASKSAAGQSSSAQPAAGGQATADEAERGRQLFNGGVGFSNGGVACASCHNVKGAGSSWGGNLAKDLSNAHSRLGGDGLRAMLAAPPFPLMKEAFADHPLTEAEVNYLIAYLQRADAAAQSGDIGTVSIYLFLAVVGLVVILGLFQAIWNGRLAGVRQSLVKGGSK